MYGVCFSLMLCLSMYGVCFSLMLCLSMYSVCFSLMLCLSFWKEGLWMRLSLSSKKLMSPRSKLIQLCTKTCLNSSIISLVVYTRLLVKIQLEACLVCEHMFVLQVHARGAHHYDAEHHRWQVGHRPREHHASSAGSQVGESHHLTALHGCKLHSTRLTLCFVYYISGI